MKKLIFIFVLSLISTISFSQEQETKEHSVVTTYYFIRHAEKQRQNPQDRNPHLTFEGYKRADNWAKVFKYIPLNAVYSTDYNRTKETAKPTADSKNLPILVYNPKNIYSESFQFNTKGKSVLVVGHSNSTPSFVNKVLGKNKYKSMDDNNNASLYVVTIIDGKVASTVLNVEMPK